MTLSSPRALALLVAVSLVGCRPEENLPPTVTGRALMTPEDTPLTFTLETSDPEGQPLVLKVTDPAHGVLTRDGASFTYTPTANFFGIDAVEVTVGDGTHSVKAAVDFTVTPVNDAPLAVADALTGSADVASSFEVSRLLLNDSDVDGDTLTVTGVGTASRGSVALSNGLLTYTPAGAQTGDVTWDYTLSDGTTTATATVTLTLATTVHPPVALDDTATTDEDTALTLMAATLAANDVDVDGDTLTLTAVSGATHGTATLSAGAITFTPDADFSGEAGFDYTVSDGTLTDQGHVTVTVTPVNDAPVASDDTATATEDTTLTLAASALLGNDTDPDGPALTVGMVSGATGGTVSLSGATITFIPSLDATGTAGFDYAVTDGTLSDTGHVVVTITAVDDAPVATDDTGAAQEDTAVTFTDAALVANDVDADQQALVVTAVGNAVNGTVSRAGGVTTFTPAANFSGQASFEYTVSDGALTDQGLVTVTVAAVNDAPVAVDDTGTTQEDTAVTFTDATLRANDSDVEGATLSITAVGAAVNGAVSRVGGVTTFTPASNFNGTASFEYTVSDGTLTDTGRVTITVSAVNDAPIAVDDTGSTNEDVALTFTDAVLRANDSDLEGTTLTITAVGTAVNGTVTRVGGVTTFTPAANFSGSASFEYTVSDGALTDVGLVVVTVTAVNDAPVAVADTRTTAEDTATTFTDAALLSNDSDPEGTALTVTAVGSAVNGTVARAGGVTTFTPAANFNGTASFQYTVSDGALTASATVTVTVTAVNDPPVAAADTGTTAEDTAVTFTDAVLVANDSDVEGTLSITAVSAAVNGTVARAGGVTTFTPAANFNGTATFQYTVTDGALTSTATVTITVTAVNDAPVAVADARTTAEDTATTFTDAVLISNDSDPEGTALTVTAVGSAVNGTVARAGGVTTFTPASNFVGTASFQYTASDGALTASTTVTVTVTAVNDPPVAVADTGTTSEDTAVTFTDAVLLANDSDPESAPSVTAVGSAVNGSVSRAGGVTTFTPTANFSGAASFQYTVSDGALTASATVTVTVTAVNDAPVAVDDTGTTSEGTAVTFTSAALTANDADVDGPSLTVTAVSGAVNGVVTLSAGVVTFTPSAAFAGVASFQYTVSDGALTDTGAVTVTVTSVNDPPVAVDDARTTAEDTAVAITDAVLLANDSDPESVPVITAVGSPVHGTVARAGGVTTFTPDANFVGTASFQYTLSDGALTDVGLVTVTVTAVNDAPVAVDDSTGTLEDTALTRTEAALLGNDVDVDGPALSISAAQNASGGTVSFSGGIVTFTPTANFFGNASFEYVVSDGTLTDVGLVTVTVTSVDDVPVAVADSATTAEETATTVPVLANDTGLGDGSLTVLISVTVPPAAGTASVTAANGILFTPATDFTGTTSLTYEVQDGDGDTAAGTLSLTVTNVNDAPLAAAQAASTAQGTPLTLTLTGSDVDSASVTFAVGTAPAHGTLGAISSTGNFTATVVYTPTGGYSGADSFTFTTNDGALGSAPATVSLTVVVTAVCGNGAIESGETCDDSNVLANDGCSAGCATETGWSCAGAPSVCAPICGDTLTRGTEQCDDGNASDTDGCTTQCRTGRVCSAVTFNGATAFATDPANGTCYATWTGAFATWGSAEASCAAVGGHLVTITSAAEQARVATVLLGVPWIGATEDANDTDAVFDWFGPEAWGFTAYAPGEPDDDAAFGGAGECLAMVNASAQWGDTNCDYVGYVDGRICEFPANPCGDGVVEVGEACDDGNTSSSDGCSATCTVEPGATCSGVAPTTCSKLVINEVDYDNAGTDTAEFVEVFNAGTAAADLTDLALVLINGSGSTEYFFDASTGIGNVGKRILLSNAGVAGNSLPVGAYLVITTANVSLPTGAGVFRYNALSTGGSLQNGAPDAVMLFRVGASPAVIDALSYEGSTGVATVLGVSGTWTVTEGSGNTAVDLGVGSDSLCRVPNGRDTQDNATDFQLRATATPGAANN